MRRDRLIRPTIRDELVGRIRRVKHRIRHQPHSTSSSLQLCAVCPNPSATCSRHHRQTSTQALRKACVASFYTGNWCQEYSPVRPYPASLPAVVLTEHCYCRQCSAAEPSISVGVIDINDALCPARFGRQPYLCRASSSPCFASSRS